LKKLFLLVSFGFLFSFAKENAIHALHNTEQTDDALFISVETEKAEILPDTAGKKGILFTANADSVEILLDSALLGIAPFVLDTLQDGTYSFLARKKGFYQKKITASYRKDTLSHVNVELRAPSSISIITKPDSALVLINRKKAGSSPFTASPLKPDEYNVMILKDGYELIDTTINLESGQNYEISVELVSENSTPSKSADKKTTSLSKSKTKNDEKDGEESDDLEKKKKRADRIGIIVFLSIMVLLLGVQEYNR